MLWTFLVLVLLGAIGFVLWLHHRQDQAWKRELENMEQGLSESAQDSVPGEPAGNPLKGKAKAAYGRTVARLRLLAVQYRQKNNNGADGREKIEYVDDSSVFSADNQLSLLPEEDAPSETPLAANADSGRPSRRLSKAPPPYIVPFVENELPEYVPRKVRNAALAEITLEEATRALGESLFQETVGQHKKPAEADPAVAATPSEETVPPIKTSRKPLEGLAVIGLDDPALRRTRERVLAGIEEIHSRQSNASAGNAADALLQKRQKAVIPVPDIPSRWDEIDVNRIQMNLARQNAARDRLAKSVAPVQDYQPQIIPNEEILANLSHTSSPLGRRSRPLRRIDTSLHQSVIPEAVRIERATVAQPKALLARTPRVQETPFIARQTAPDAMVVEQPELPETAPAIIDIPEPPAFKSPPELTLSQNEINAHVSHKPQRSINDFLISESADEADDALYAHYGEVFPEAGHVSFPSGTAAGGRDGMPSESRGFENRPRQGNASAASGVFAKNGSRYLPDVDLLLPPQFDPTATQTEEALMENSITIEEKLAEFKVKVKVVDSYSGPVITRYEIEPDVGVRGNAVLNLEKDLARSLGVASIRVVETIPGKTCMGLELPNPRRQMIRLSEIFNSPVFTDSQSKLTLALGQDITGQPVVTDLAKAPHLLVAGTTGSGKSVGVNAMILSMLFKASPEDVRMIMIDPKMLELSIYEGIPHLLAPVVTDMRLAANALNWCVNEMEKRYRLMSHIGVRNLNGFNQKITEAAARGEKIANPFSLSKEHPEPLEKLPFIVVVVDEFADLMMTAGKKIEELIARLAQKARAAGIHLILATQRPSVDVITGLIKANIPTRIAFQVSSKIDSRTILDQMGAENLLGQGDMLFLPPGTQYPQRVHGAFASDEEVHRVVEYLKEKFGEPDYVEEIFNSGTTDDLPGMGRNDSENDPMYDEAVALVVKTRKASISSVQRGLRIGYNRAARLIEQMEADGIVSAAESNGNRNVLSPESRHLD